MQNQILGNKIVCSNEAHRKQNLQIIALCLENDCQNKKTLCSQCFEIHDKNHQIIELQHLQEQLEHQQQFLNKKRNDQFQNLSKLQNQCFKLMQDKLQNMAQDAASTKKLSEQKIDAELKQSIISNYKNEEDLEKLQQELVNKVSKDQFNPKLTRLLVEKNILFGYERYIRQLLFDSCLYSDQTDFLEECEFFSDDQLMNLKNLSHQINEIRQQVIVGFQDQQQNMLYLQQISDQLNYNYSIYQSQNIEKKQQEKKKQQEILSDEQKQQFHNLGPIPIGQILQNYPLEQLTNNQFKLVYSQTFYDVISLKQIDFIKKSTNEKSLICFGAVENSNQNQLALCAIDYVDEVFQNTNSFKMARKSKNGQMYWYYKYGLFCGVVGFSAFPEIDIGHQLNIHYDNYNLGESSKFSMQVNYKSECRVGGDLNQAVEKNFYWQIYIRN